MSKDIFNALPLAPLEGLVPAVGIEPTRPQGTRDFESIISKRRFPIKFKYLDYRELQDHIGLAWIILENFRLRRLHF